MTKLYLDIDGVLLTAKRTQAATGVDAFVAFVTSKFECYWLTTHCKGDNNSALKYLSQFLQPTTLEKLRNTVQPTNWDALKTEAIDIQSDFYWLDDQPFQAELVRLQTGGAKDRIIIVNLSRPNELLAVQETLQQLLQDRLRA